MVQYFLKIMVGSISLVFAGLVISSGMVSPISAAPLLITPTPTPTRAPDTTQESGGDQVAIDELEESDANEQFRVAFLSGAAFMPNSTCYVDLRAHARTPYPLLESSRLSAYELAAGAPLQLPVKACGYEPDESLTVTVTGSNGRQWLRYAAKPTSGDDVGGINKTYCYDTDSVENPILPGDIPPAKYTLGVYGQSGAVEQTFWVTPPSEPEIFHQRQQNRFVLTGFEPGETVWVTTLLKTNDLSGALVPVRQGRLTVNRAGQVRITDVDENLIAIVVRDNYQTITTDASIDTTSFYNLQLQQNPSNPDLHYQIALQNDLDEKHLSIAINLRPDFVPAYLARAKPYGSFGNVTQQEADLLKALDLAPDSVAVQTALTQFYLNLGNVGKALKHYIDLSNLTDIPSQLFEDVSIETIIDLSADRYQLSYSIDLLTWAINNQTVPSTDLYKLRAELYLQTGQRREAAQDFINAVEADHGGALCDPQFYDRVLDLTPAHALSYYRRGILYANEAIYGGNANSEAYNRAAINDFTQALAYDPGFMGAYLERGKAYAQLGNYSAAQDDSNAFLRSMPDYMPAYYERAKLYQAWGKIDSSAYRFAWNDYNTVIQNNPLSKLYVERAQLLDQMGYPNNAVTDYKQALEMGYPYISSEALNRIIQAYPQTAPAYYFRAQKLEWSDRNGAIADYKTAIRYDSSFVEAYLALARLYDSQGDKTRAVDKYLEAIRLEQPAPEQLSDLQNAHSYLIAYYEQSGRLDYALWVANHWLETQPYDIILLEKRASLRVALGYSEAALADYDQLVKIGGSPKAYFLRGGLYHQLGNRRQAATDFTQALVRMNINRSYEINLGDLNSAVDLLPYNAKAYYWRGVHLAGVDPDRAINDFEQVLRYATDPRLAKIASQELEILKR